jgi:2,3-bisphosphoglycerate-independent phosphoglycerate mutase
MKVMRSTPALHLIGLTSDGGVHSHVEHLELLLKEVRRDFHGPIYLHVITDGRDTGPTTGAETVAALERSIAGLNDVRIATVCGRFFAMDRDKRWERTKKAYDCIAGGIGTRAESGAAWLKAQYAAGITDEFIEPAIITPAPLAPTDGFIFWNFREDRARQIVRALTAPDFKDFDRPAPPIAGERVLCFTEYDHSFGLPYIFEALSINDHLGEIVARAGLKQLRAAETEKYPHVTYFLNGGIEKPYAGEERVLVPSPRDVKTYDQKPEMSAFAVTEKVVEAIRSGDYALIVVNLANGDMVGHTGVMDAAVKAVETVDTCLGQMVAALTATGGNGIIIADHGNAEQMINLTDGTPHTAHTTNPVPCIVVGVPTETALRDDGALCDVAPTVLELMHLPQSAAMTGLSLLKA